LMEGHHPFTGVLTSGLSVGRVDLYAIREGLFPYGQTSAIKSPPAAPPLEMLHPLLRQAFKRCFEQGHHQPTLRPMASQWVTRLNKAESLLVQCMQKKDHIYSNHYNHCPWCRQQLLSLSKSLNKPAFKPPTSPQTATSAPAISQKRTIHQPPKQINIEQGSNLIITQHWSNRVEKLSLLIILFICILPFQVLLIGTLFMFLGAQFLLFAESLFMKLIPTLTALILSLLFATPLLWGTYQAIAWLFNKTTITVNQKLLISYTKPISIRGHIEIPVADIQQLFCKRRAGFGGEQKPTYEVYALTYTGEYYELAGRFSSYEQARYIEQMVQKYLNLPNIPVPGEYIE